MNRPWIYRIFGLSSFDIKRPMFRVSKYNPIDTIYIHIRCTCTLLEIDSLLFIIFFLVPMTLQYIHCISIYIHIYYVYIVISFKPIKEFAPFGFTAQVRRTPDTWGHLGTPGDTWETWEARRFTRVRSRKITSGKLTQLWKVIFF